MIQQWIAMESYRLRVVAKWPEGPRKEATMEAIRSALTSLLKDPRAAAASVQVAALLS